MVVIAVSIVGLVLGLVRAMTSPLSRQVAEFQAEMTQLRTETAQQFAELRTEMTQQFAQMNTKLDGLSRDISGVRERVARIEERVGIPAEPVSA